MPQRATLTGSRGHCRNYLTLGSGLSVAGVFFHPMLLMLIGVLYYAHRRAQSDEPIVVMGRQLGGELPSFSPPPFAFVSFARRVTRAAPRCTMV